MVKSWIKVISKTKERDVSMVYFDDGVNREDAKEQSFILSFYTRVSSPEYRKGVDHRHDLSYNQTGVRVLRSLLSMRMVTRLGVVTLRQPAYGFRGSGRSNTQRCSCSG